MEVVTTQIGVQSSADPVPHDYPPRRRKACENCRRRKERCDGLDPCGRCRRRRVEHDCRRQPSTCHPALQQGKTTLSTISPQLNGAGIHDTAALADDADVSNFLHGLTPSSNSPSLSTAYRDRVISSSLGSTVLHTSPLVRNGQGASIVLGPSANLSVLQATRKLVRSAIGSCSLTDERSENDLIDEESVSIVARPGMPIEPERPSADDAHYYLEWYTNATSCVLDLFEYEELVAQVIPWLQKPVAGDAISCMNFLVLAIGAQCAPEDRDVQADAYFTYGHQLATARFIGTVDYLTVQIYCLIAAYLLNATRPSAAKMHLSVAIQAAHSLGIHKPDILDLYSPEEVTQRERIWKVIRVSDLFLSTYLGQHPSTTETRDTLSQHKYSASTDLCYIFEKILIGIYAKQEVSPQVLEHVSRHHREWALHFPEGLLTDHIPFEGDFGCQAKNKTPNIGLCHLKEAYYWTIMLITRPYLLELAQKRVANISHSVHAGTVNDMCPSPQSQFDPLLAHASVNSAVLTIDLLQGFLTAEKIPKRLPFIINSTLNAALILGIGFFAELDNLFPLSQAMRLAEKLLHRFETHDAMARWSLHIVQELHNACDIYTKQRCESRLKHQRNLVKGLFGDVISSASGIQTFPSASLSPQSHPQDLHFASETETFPGLDKPTSSEFLRSLQLSENSAICSQLFYNDPSDPLCEPGQGPQELANFWT